MRESTVARTASAVFFVTAEGKAAWEASRDSLRGKVRSHTESLNAERLREIDEQQDVQRELDLARRALSHAEHILFHCEVVEPASSSDCVAIGTIVTYQQYNEHGKAVGEAETVLVGEYGVGDLKAKPRVVPYDNLILLNLLGSHKGADVSIRLLNRKEHTFEILDVQLPAEYPPVRLVAVA